MSCHRSLRKILTAATRLIAVAAIIYGPPASPAVDPATLSWIQSTLDQWDQACRKDIHIDPKALPWIIFFNQNLAWHVNPDLTLLPAAAIHTHTAVLFRERKYEI